MTGLNSFPIDLVLFGVVALLLVLRLRSILGKRTGFERPPQPLSPRIAEPLPVNGRAGPVIDGTAAVAPLKSRAMPEPASEIGQVLARMAMLDPSFSSQGFLDGAERAFRMIVLAFAAGERAKLRPLLGDDMYRAFDTAIGAREAAGETQTTEIKAMPAITYEAAEIHGASVGELSVRFVSDQINMTVSRDGKPVAGTDAVTEIVDIWTFERDLANRKDPSWRLVAARSA
jgi:predicted lipid-binding transport protein (Tim44 family)